MASPDPRQVLVALLRLAELDPAIAKDVELSGTEPVLPSSFAVGTAAQATIAAAASADATERASRHARSGMAKLVADGRLHPHNAYFLRLRSMRGRIGVSPR